MVIDDPLGKVYFYIFIKSPDEWATTKQACRDKRVVRLNLFL